MTSSFDEFDQGIRDTVRRIEQDLGPDEDWAPMAFVQDYQGRATLLALHGALFATEESKDALAEALGKFIVGSFGVRFAMVFSAWTIDVEGDPSMIHDDDWVPVSEREDRRECVFVTTLDLDDARAHRAMVTRLPDRRPKLGEWEEYESAFVEGRYLDAARSALTLVRDIAEHPLEVLRSIRDRAESKGDDTEDIDALIAYGETNPDGPEGMPIARWRKSGVGPGEAT